MVALETEIARTHWTREKTGDMAAGNNTWRRAEFARRAPGLDWDAFFGASGFSQKSTTRGRFLPS